MKFQAAGKRPRSFDGDSAHNGEYDDISENSLEDYHGLQKRQRMDDSVSTENFLLEHRFSQHQSNFAGQLIARQKKGRKVTSQAISDAQKKIELLNRFQDPNYNRDNKKRQAEIKDRLSQAEQLETRELLVEMDHANDADHQCIKEAFQLMHFKSEESKIASSGRGQAMNRFNLLPKLGEMLRKKGV